MTKAKICDSAYILTDINETRIYFKFIKQFIENVKIKSMIFKKVNNENS